MKPLIVTLFFVFFLVSACKKDSCPTSPLIYLKAVVANTHDISCGYPSLDFSEDSLAIREITKEKWNMVVVSNLPSELNIQNKKLYIALIPLKPEEEFPCLAIGIWYPHLKILDAKER